MKKTVLVIAAAALFAVTFASCGSSKPPCPAYRAQVDVEIPAEKL